MAKIAGTLVPLNPNVPVVSSENVSGGFRSVADEAERLAIPVAMLEVGSHVFQDDTNATWRVEAIVEGAAVWELEESVTWATIPGKPAVVAEGATQEAARQAISAIDQASVLALSAGPFICVSGTIGATLLSPVVIGDPIPSALSNTGAVWAAGLMRFVSAGPGPGRVATLQADGTWVVTFNPADYTDIDWTTTVAAGLSAGVFHFRKRGGGTVTSAKSNGADQALYGTNGDGAVVSLYSKLGDMASLATAAKASLVGAINELKTDLGSIDYEALDNKPAVIAAGADAAAARAAIGAGTSSLALGTTGGTALEGSTSFVSVNGTSVKGSGDLKVGYRNIPQNSQSADYTTTIADAGGGILHPSADTTARTFTIPANSSVPYEVGTAITFTNQNGTGGVVTIAITTDTMRLAGAGTTGSRTLARNGIATALKITATEWIISGAGLT